MYYGSHYLLTETTNNVERPHRHLFRIYSYDSSTGARLANYENYYLPTVNADRTGYASYTILTSKSAVTVAQGGTGVTTAKGSAKNPAYLSSDGVAACNAFTRLHNAAFNSGSVDFSEAYSKYNYLIIEGQPSTTTTTAYTTIYVPTTSLSTADTIFSFANQTAGASIKLKRSGTGNNDITMTWNASSDGTGRVTRVYGGI